MTASTSWPVQNLSLVRGLARGRNLKLSMSAVALVVDYLPTYDCRHDFALADSCRINSEDVLAEQNHVRKLARGDRAFLSFLEFRVCGAQGVRLDGFWHCELLLGKPAIGILAVQSRASHGRINRQHRVKGSNLPIATERQAHAMVQKGAKRISTAGAVMADALLSPASIVDGVIGLDRGDDVQLREAVKIFCGHVLCMFDPKTSVALAIRFHHFAVEIEDHRNGLVSDGVSANLQADRISLHHAIPH